MKKKLSVLLTGVALVALFVAPVSALKESGEEDKNSVNLSCLTGAGLDSQVAEEHVYDLLNVEDGSVVYNEDGEGIDRKYLKDTHHVFDVDGEIVLVNKKTLKLYNYDENYNLVAIR